MVFELYINKADKKKGKDFPGGPVAKNQPDSAEDTGSNPGPGKFHMCGTTSPCATTTETAL